MGAWIGAALAGVLALALSACDRQGRPIEEFGLDKLEKGVSSEGDVRTVMGQPETVWVAEDGTRRMQYPKGPEGVRTWEFTIDRAGTLKDYRQLLNKDNFSRVQQGMTQDEIRRMLGKPRSVAQFKLKNEEVWDWKYQEGTDPRLFNVHFDMGTHLVTRTSTSDALNY